MKNLGKLILTQDDETCFKVGIHVTPAEVIYGYGGGLGTDAQVTVQYSGVFMGTQDQLTRYIFDEVEEFLYKNGYLIKRDTTTLVLGREYVPSEKLWNEIKEM